MEVEVYTIYGDKKRNEFMQCADVFEQGKHLGKLEVMCVKGTEKMDVENLCENVKNALEGSGQNVIFVGIRSIDGVRQEKPSYYLKPNVQTISDGKRFGLFKDHLESLGYVVQTSERMEVTRVTF